MPVRGFARKAAGYHCRMKIAWVIFGALEQSAQGLTSSVASIRYRALLPALELAKSGVDSNFVVIPPQGEPVDSGAVDVDVDAVVFCKSFNALNETLAQRARERGAQVVFDISDNHFVTPQYAAHYRAMVGLAHSITVPTTAMAQAVQEHTGRSALVIPDPVEGHRATPVLDAPGWGIPRGWLQSRLSRAPAAAPLRLLWFGHPANLPALGIFAGHLGKVLAQGPVLLRVVSQAGPEADAACAMLAQHGVANEFVPWSLAATRTALDWCHLVVIPSGTGHERARVKSANRLVESLWAGRYVVASPIEAYQDFAEYAWVSDDLADGILWAVRHHEVALRQIAHAQEHIAENLTQAAAAAQWLGAVSGRGAIGRSAARGSALTGNALRLNLGCGDKPLPGYLNVDVAASRLGRHPDVLADLRARLPFPDGCADEVMAIHVIEHFWRWEVAEVVREWARVLRPGGRLILECPNLIAACEAFLANPDERAQPDARGQTSMWVFYGDPQWRDPLMVHRWGYTPTSLSNLLREAGLVEPHQEPAQFKLREPRDMRIVATRPA